MVDFLYISVVVYSGAAGADATAASPLGPPKPGEPCPNAAAAAPSTSAVPSGGTGEFFIYNSSKSIGNLVFHLL